MAERKRYTVVFYQEEIEAYVKLKKAGFSDNTLTTKDRVAIFSFDKRLQDALRGTDISRPSDVRKIVLQKEKEAERSHGECAICHKPNMDLYAGACQTCFREWVKSTIS